MSESLPESNVFNLEEPEVFFFFNCYFFLLHYAVCTIFIPQPGTDPKPPAAEAWSLTLDHQRSPGPELSLIEKFKICVCVLSLGIERKVRLLIENIFLVSAYLSFSM